MKLNKKEDEYNKRIKGTIGLMFILMISLVVGVNGFLIFPGYEDKWCDDRFNNATGIILSDIRITNSPFVEEFIVCETISGHTLGVREIQDYEWWMVFA